MKRVVAIVVMLAFAFPVPAAHARPRPAASAWIVVDNATGKVLASHQPDLPLHPASTTKMLTAQVVLDHARLDEIVVIGANAANAQADHMRWPLGARFTVEQMLHGMLMVSSNGAAIALAEHISGTVQNFTHLMRFKARGLGITESTWNTPEGLDTEGQLATSRDLATVARNLLTYPVLARIARTRTYDMPWPGGRTRLVARNHFLTHYRGAIGVKPGYTTLARNTLAAAAERNGRVLIAVVMRTPSPTSDAAMLLDEHFARSAPKQEKRRLKLFFAAAGAPEPVQEVAEAALVPFEPAGAAAVPIALSVYLCAGTLVCVLVLRAVRRKARRAHAK